MGLDMYLSAERSFYTKYTKDSKKMDAPEARKIRRIFPEMFKTGNLNYIHLEFEVGYWRKANHIHKWFVDNVQNGKDDCGNYYVTREDLQKLLCLCKEIVEKTKLKDGKVINGYSFENGKRKPNFEDGKIIENPEIAKELLPIQEGFFFGGTEYDYYYLEDIKETIKIIEKCLKLPEEWSFEYHSSW